MNATYTVSLILLAILAGILIGDQLARNQNRKTRHAELLQINTDLAELRDQLAAERTRTGSQNAAVNAGKRLIDWENA